MYSVKNRQYNRRFIIGFDGYAPDFRKIFFSWFQSSLSAKNRKTLEKIRTIPASRGGFPTFPKDTAHSVWLQAASDRSLPQGIH